MTFSTFRLGANYRRAPNAIRPLSERAALSKMQATPCDWFAALPANGDPLGNDRYSNCWEVARRMVIALRRANADGEVIYPTLQPILSDYTLLTGFNQLTGTPDDGTDTDSAMLSWCRYGVQVNDQTLDVPHWLTVDPAIDEHVMLATQSAGPLMATWRLPMALQDPAAWSAAPGTGTDWTTVWGEHEVPLGKTDGEALVWVRTWGNDLEVHPDIRRRFMISIDVPLDLSPGGWLETTGLTPAGLDADALRADMASVAVAK